MPCKGPVKIFPLGTGVQPWHRLQILNPRLRQTAFDFVERWFAIRFRLAEFGFAGPRRSGPAAARAGTVAERQPRSPHLR